MPAPATDQKPLLLYLHGFNSSPGSRKACELEHYLASSGAQCDYQVPQLDYHPLRAMNTVLGLIEEAGPRPLALVGSSLGGYYASALSARLACRAALVNPAVYPYRLLRDYLGWQRNPYTGERYHLSQSELDALLALEAAPPPENLLVLLQTGDETLDYRQARERFADARQWIVPGGDHRFRDFPRFLPAVLGFLGISHSVPY